MLCAIRDHIGVRESQFARSLAQSYLRYVEVSRGRTVLAPVNAVLRSVSMRSNVTRRLPVTSASRFSYPRDQKIHSHLLEDRHVHHHFVFVVPMLVRREKIAPNDSRTYYLHRFAIAIVAQLAQLALYFNGREERFFLCN